MKQSDKYKFNLAEDDDFYDISHQSDNWKRADDILGGFETPEFDDSGTVEGITGFPAFLETVKSKMKIFDFFKNFTAGMKFVLHTGQLVNNGLTTEVGKYPLDAAYGKTLTDMYSQLNDKLGEIINGKGIINPDYYISGGCTYRVVNGWCIVRFDMALKEMPANTHIISGLPTPVHSICQNVLFWNNDNKNELGILINPFETVMITPKAFVGGYVAHTFTYPVK